MTSEVNPVSILLANDWANIERLGPYALSTWTGEGQTEPLWAALNDGTIDVVGTDHAPHTREEKELGWTDMWKASGGLPHLQETLPLFLTQVAAGRLSLERLVEVTSSAPARLLGLWPRKGGDPTRRRRRPRRRRPGGARRHPRGGRPEQVRLDRLGRHRGPGPASVDPGARPRRLSWRADRRGARLGAARRYALREACSRRAVGRLAAPIEIYVILTFLRRYRDMREFIH